jgi:folate/biopterin transporter
MLIATMQALTIYLLSSSAQFHRVNSFLHPSTRIALSPTQRIRHKTSAYPKHNFILHKQPSRTSIVVKADVKEVVPNTIDTTNNNGTESEDCSDDSNSLINGKIELMQSESETSNIEGNSIWKTLFLGIEPTPDIVAIATIYFVEGALGLARLAQTFLLKDEFKLGPAELSATLGLLSLPWTIKPLYGFLSDGFPILGYRRRSYLVLAGFVGFLSYMVLAFGLDVVSAADGVDTSMAMTITIISLLLSSASIALSDVVADGIVVQKTRDASEQGDDAIAGGLQSLCWGSAAIGALISAYFSGSLLESMSPREVFGIASVLPLAVSGISFMIQEEPVGKQKVNGEVNDVEMEQTEASVSEQMSSLWSAMRQPNIYKPVLFLFLWKATPTSDGAMLYFMTDDIGFGPEFLGRVRLVTAASSLLGVFLYNQYLRRVPIKDVLLWTSIVSVPLGLTQLLLISHYNRELGIPDGAFVFGDDVVLSILGEIAFLPTLVLAARLCPPGIEAVLFATLMSIYNGASTVGTEVGAGLTKLLSVTETDFSNLALLTIICNVSSLLPLVFIGWLDGVGDESQEEMEAKQYDGLNGKD